MVIQNSTEYNFLLNRNKKTTSSLKKNLEKLSSGYEVNRAADDAAGLAVSEKMRGIIAGLKQGVENINDGISYIHSVDGASQEIHNILHRLYVLADQAANGTYDNEVDRRAIDREYQQLIDEISHMTDTANFNDLPLFEQHMSEYGLYEGTVIHDEPIIIDETNDRLVFGYIHDGAHKEIVLELEHGRYLTPEELADEIDTVLYGEAHDLIIGVDSDGKFTIQCENGDMEYVCGTGASLFYQSTPGFSGGYLLGVTDFLTETAELKINEDKNDLIQFRFANENVLHSIRIDEGFYTRRQLVDAINKKFEEAGISDTVKAEATTTPDGKHVIALNSKDAVTGLAGNFIRMDTKSGEDISNQSPIYDISYYADETNTQADFDGKKVIDKAKGVEIVRGRNDYFYVKFSDYDSPEAKEYKISLLDDSENDKVYTRKQLADRINAEFAKNDIRAKALCNDDTLGTIDISTKQYGEKCLLEIVDDKVPSDYALKDLFDSGNLIKVNPKLAKSSYVPFKMQAYKYLMNGTKVTSSTDELQLKVTYRNNVTQGTTTSEIITLDLGVTSNTTMSKDAIVSKLNSELSTKYSALADVMEFSVNGSGLLLKGKDGIVSDNVYKVDVVESCTAYRTLIRDVTYSDVSRAERGTSTQVYTDKDESNRLPYYTTKGSTSAANSYVNQQNSSPGQTVDYLRYQNVSVTPVKGTSTNTATGESQVGEYKHTTGSTTFNNVGTLFTAAGTHGCLKAFSLKLDFFGRNNTSLGSKTINVSKGDTYDVFKSRLEEALRNDGGDRLGTVSYNGNSFTITTTEQAGHCGDQARIEASGTMLKSATVSSAAGQKGAVVDWDTGTVNVPPTLTVANLQSHFEGGKLVLYKEDQKDASGNVIQKKNNIMRLKCGSASYDLDLAGTYRSVAELCLTINGKLSALNVGITAERSADGKGVVFTGTAGGETLSVETRDFDGQSRLGETKMTASGVEGAEIINGNIVTPAKLVFTQITKHFPFKPTSSTNTIVFNYKTASGADKSLTVTLDTNKTYYSGYELENAINNSQANKDLGDDGLTAAYSNGQLTVSTKSKGAGAQFANPPVGGTSNLQKFKNSSETIPGGIVTSAGTVDTQAHLYNNYFYTLDDMPMIIDSSNKTIKLNVNGNTKTATLAEGTYSSLSTLYEECKKKIEAACTGADEVKVSYTGGYYSLVLTTKKAGTAAFVDVASGNTAPIFSYASVDTRNRSNQCVDNRCEINGTRDISEGVTLHYWDNSFTFDLTPEGATSAETKTITLFENDLTGTGTEGKTYTADDIKTELQNKINDIAGFADTVQTIPRLTVSLVNGKLMIKGTVSSATLGMKNFEGRLFDKIFQAANYTNVQNHKETKGKTVGDTLSYLIGRNDMDPETEEEIETGKNVMIYTRINDEITFDFTYNGFLNKISYQIDSGLYTREELADEIERRGREIFANLRDENGNRFPPDFFNVSIGLDELSDFGVGKNNTGISSENKLVFWCKLPEDGSHKDVSIIIDGMRGNSAYKIFYDTTVSPSPTKILGHADLSKGLTVDDSNDKMSFRIDGETVSIKIAHNTYDSCEAVCEAVNKALEAAGGKAGAMAMGDHILFYSTKNGAFVFDKFSGGGADDIFYGKESRDEDTEIGIMVGRRTDDYIMIQKTRVDDHLMHINTTGITTVERALKAMERLDDANNYLSRWRGLSGANENRSEHTLNRTVTYIENLSAAESRIRDTDVAEQVAKMTKNQILMQAQQAMFSAVKEHQSSALNALA